ncbi:protein farnesyltransferase/geranylgeranyltransferase type-1 subunit alpha [Sitodiplosis mosellana]|uniref:protein farnesyltransferase/geranylgeranyltransferase type-1 subunit alpha n=1 Tax=Sitodiplosis mosellana TaxID=263140 RepID=UPI00244464C9|nr:protein farnesyltransferase/geranylgeranyltransferase type-1 subunit alpha [Sitodiplosis mosellana]XP_055300960.1 protein farnesyltransferase/geranylgeranyltransferase type-1 subunit alpha [Sitodiplosis mosellana]
MADSSDEEFSKEWIPYAKRPEWKDVVPLEQDDGENPVVVIAYSERFKDVYNYFRAIISTGEKSLRALHLTDDALKLNASNYTVWQYRRDILRSLDTNLNEELEYTEEIICRNPKSYQVWHHRRVIVEWLNDGTKELELTEQVLGLDAKNYHAWQHRQWAIKTYNLFDNELIFVDRLIGADLRNNSAWNQRYFVLNHTGFTPEVIQYELNYVMNRIRLVKNNESTWNYLRGLLQHGTGKLDQYPEVVDFCEELYVSGVRSPFLLAFLVDLYQEKRLDWDESNNEDDPKQLEEKVNELCNQLISTHDTIRAKYWEYILNKFKIKLSRSGTTYQESNTDSNQF